MWSQESFGHVIGYRTNKADTNEMIKMRYQREGNAEVYNKNQTTS